MTLTAFVTWMVVAVLTGWIAGIAVKPGSHGIRADILLAVAGSGLASGVAAGFDLFAHSGFAASAAVAFPGAVAVIAVQRTLFDAPLG